MHYEIQHSQEDLNLIYAALGELPLKVTVNLFLKLKREQERQDKEKAVPLSSIRTAARKKAPAKQESVEEKKTA